MNQSQFKALRTVRFMFEPIRRIQRNRYILSTIIIGILILYIVIFFVKIKVLRD